MSHKIIIPNKHPHHQKLSDMINSFAGKYDILRVFLSYSATSQKHLIIIHISDTHVPEEITKSKWIVKALERFDTHIIVMGMLNVRIHLKRGTLYINRHCDESSLVFIKTGHEFLYPEISEQLKRFKQFKEDYYHSQFLLDSEIQKAKDNKSLPTAYHLYCSIFKHYISYLEFMCVGNNFSNGSLSERLNRLEKFVPEIKFLFLRKTEISYYIIEALESAGEADEHEDYFRIKNEFADAIDKTENKLNSLVQNIFSDTKKAIKKLQKSPLPIKCNEISPFEPVLNILTKHYNIEEIFLFSQQEVYSAEQKTKVLYLLLIGDSISNQNLFDMMQIVSQQTEGRFNIVPIAHKKAWIQERLFVHQDFFKKVMTPENSIFRADVPTIMHWIIIDEEADTDEGIYYRLCNDLYKNYKLLRLQENHLNNEGLGLLLSGFFYRACIIFIYVALHYEPNQINIRILWKLCENVDPNVKKLDYLIQKLPFDFFEFLNPSKNLYRNFGYLREEHLCILDELAESFLDLVDKQFE